MDGQWFKSIDEGASATALVVLACTNMQYQVFLPAIAGHVPDDMVRCVAALLGFCYLAWQSSHTTSTLQEMDIALAAFHRYRQIFEDVDICPDGFGMPWQHSLVHYTFNICLFGALTGLDSAITKSKHIRAVKEPWRESNRVHAISQMITKNSRLSQMAALQVKFARQKMLPTVEVACVDNDDKINGPDNEFSVDGYVRVSARQGMSLNQFCLSFPVLSSLHDH
jgi:hypothetical protein